MQTGLYIILKVASFATIVEHPWSISHLSNIDSRFLIFAYDGLLQIDFLSSHIHCPIRLTDVGISRIE